MYDPRTCFYLRPRSRDMAILSIEAQEVEYVLSSKGEMPISWPIYVEKVKTSYLLREGFKKKYWNFPIRR